MNILKTIELYTREMNYMVCELYLSKDIHTYRASISEMFVTCPLCGGQTGEQENFVACSGHSP